jgi:hypothetical protein
LKDEVAHSSIDINGKPSAHDVPRDIVMAFKADPAIASSLPSRVHSLPYVMLNGVRYSVSSKHLGNSCAMILDGEVGRQGLVPVIIRDIIQDSNDPQKVYLVAQRHEKLTSDVLDPFLQYPVLRASMWSRSLSQHLCILQLHEIQGHFAKCDITWKKEKVSVVMALCKVIFAHFTQKKSPMSLEYPPRLYNICA